MTKSMKLREVNTGTKMRGIEMSQSKRDKRRASERRVR